MTPLFPIACIATIFSLLAILYAAHRHDDAKIGAALRKAAGSDDRAWLAVRETECAAQLERALAAKYASTVRRTNVVRLVPRNRGAA